MDGANKNTPRANFLLKMNYFFSQKMRKTKKFLRLEGGRFGQGRFIHIKSFCNIFRQSCRCPDYGLRGTLIWIAGLVFYIKIKDSARLCASQTMLIAAINRRELRKSLTIVKSSGDLPTYISRITK